MRQRGCCRTRSWQRGSDAVAPKHIVQRSARPQQLNLGRRSTYRCGETRLAVTSQSILQRLDDLKFRNTINAKADEGILSAVSIGQFIVKHPHVELEYRITKKAQPTADWASS
jgi:hypothetical protein